MPIDPWRKRLHPRHHTECRERIQTRADISQNGHSDVQDIGHIPELLPHVHPMVPRRRFREMREFLSMHVPGKFSAVDDHASDGLATASDPFGCGVNHNVSTVVDRTDDVPSRAGSVVANLRLVEGVVITYLVDSHDERDARDVCNAGDGFKVRYGESHAADTLDVYSAGILVNRSPKGIRVVDIHEFDGNVVRR